MAKLIKAPNLKAQDSSGNDEIIICVGTQAWDFAQQLKEQARSTNELILSNSFGDKAKKRPCVVITSEILESINQYQIAPKKARVITLWRANRAEKLNEVDIAKLCNNIAFNTQATLITMVDESGEELENLSNYIIRLRNGDATVIDNSELDLNARNVTEDMRISAFLKWHESPLRRDVLLGRTYQYDGLKWDVVNDEQIKRKILAFFKAYKADYSINKINKLAELVTIGLDEIPMENPDFLGFKNGVLNKRTGEFISHSIDHYLRFIEPYECETGSLETPRFDNWLEFVSYGDQDKKQVILSALYMILTNRHEWHLFIEASGDGGAGKSVFGEIATSLNGRSKTAIISLKGFEDIKSRSSLVGKTFSYSPDQAPYKGSADDFKAITGGDTTTVKFLYQDEFEIKINTVFMMTTNYPILFTDRNGGVARRRVIIKFDRPIPEEVKDVHFVDKVKKEIYGIVNKLLTAFPDPEVARTILHKHKNKDEGIDIKRQSNHLIDFASAFTVKNEQIARGLYWGSAWSKKTSSNALYKYYLDYCSCCNLKTPLGLQTFKQALPDALRENGEKFKVFESRKDGMYMTNIHWKDRQATLQEWEA